MAAKRRYNLVLKGHDEENLTRLKEEMASLFGVGAGEVEDILNSAPIVLFGELDEEESQELMNRLESVSRLGARLETIDEEAEHLPKIQWPEPPRILKEIVERESEKRESEKEEPAKKTAGPEKEKGKGKKEKEGKEPEEEEGKAGENKDEERRKPEKEKPPARKKRRRKAGKEELEAAVKEEVGVDKYEFVIDEKLVFHCPACGAMFHLRQLSAEDAQEARAQEEIRRLLEMKESKAWPAAPGGGEGEAVAVSPAEESAEALELPEEELDVLKEELPIVKEPLAVPFPSSDQDVGIREEALDLNLEDFERGLREAEEEEEESSDLPEDQGEPEPEPLMEELPSLGTGDAEEAEATEDVEEEAVEAAEEEPTAAPAPEEAETPGAVLLESLKELPEEEHPALLGAEETPEESPAAEPEVAEAPPEEKPTYEEVPPEELLRIMEARKKRKAMEKLRAAKKKRGGEKAPSARPVRPTRIHASVKPPAPENREAARKEAGGGYGIVISRIHSAPEKRRRAVAIMVEELSIDEKDARTRCEGQMIVNVARNVSRERAAALYKRFREAGITARIVEPRRRKPHK